MLLVFKPVMRMPPGKVMANSSIAGNGTGLTLTKRLSFEGSDLDFGEISFFFQYLQPGGEFSWFFDAMQLTHREGSFLFVHAGLDDQVIDILSNHSEARLNALYREQITGDLFRFYFGPLANTMRTKYRDVDFPLTDSGVAAATRQGVHAVVHGHHNRTLGQNIVLHQGMIHIEGDITLDRNSRIKEGLSGHGVGVTIIRPEGQVIGISNDYPYAKVFEPQRYQ